MIYAWIYVTLHKCTESHDHMIICCAVPEIQCMKNKTFIFYFELFSVCPAPPSTPLIPKNRKKKNLILHMCTKNCDLMMYGSWNNVRDGSTDWQTDGQKKWHIEIDIPPKKFWQQSENFPSSFLKILDK